MRETTFAGMGWDDRPFIATEAGKERIANRALLKRSMYLLTLGTDAQRQELAGAIATTLDEQNPETCPECGEPLTDPDPFSDCQACDERCRARAVPMSVAETLDFFARCSPSY